MKYYKVIYYNGKTDQATVIPGKSANEAMDKARELLRKKKVVGAAVRNAERIHWTVIDCTPKGEYLRASEVARIIKERR